MSTEVLLKGFFAVILGCIFAWTVFHRHSEEAVPEPEDGRRQRYLPYVPGMLLPLFLLVYIGLTLVVYGGIAAFQAAISMCFGIFLHISIYYIF